MIVKFNSIGSDPEFAISDNDGKYLPSFIFFEGTKEFPEDKGGGFKILKDNLLVEGNIPPSKTKQEFIDSMEVLKDIIKIALKQHEASLICADIVSYDDEYIYTMEGQEFGCQPNLNAYMDDEMPAAQLKGNLRSLGCHVHVGIDIINENINKDLLIKCLVKSMDYHLMIPSDLIHHSKERRKQYGALGSYRITPYGFEARALGGFFAQKKYLGWIYDQTVKAVEFCNNMENLEKLMQVDKPLKKHATFLGIDIKNQIKTLKELA